MKQTKRLIGLVLILTLAITTGCTKEGPTAPQPPAVQEPMPTEEPEQPPTEKPETAASERPKTDEPETTEPKEEIDYSKRYQTLLDDYYELIVTNDGWDYPNDGEIGVVEATLGLEPAQALEHIGYTIEDISGDGIPELLITSAHRDEDGQAIGSSVFAAYTYQDGAPHLSFISTARSNYRYKGQGQFHYVGSAGAIYSILGSFTISDDGTTLINQDYYFTHEKDENYDDIAVFYNDKGIWDREESIELDMTLDDLWQLEREQAEEIVEIDITPFSDYTPTRPIDVDLPRVSVDWIEGTPDGEYDEFVVDETEPQVKILLEAITEVEDLRLLALTYEDHPEGQITFSTEELHHLDRLTPERPLVVRLAGFGTIPNFGISYKDKTGATKYYAVTESGRDGSLLLMEFEK
ncbi:MAG TPA: hypothetical protein GXZ74_00885 [Tissierellia bacterium]|nr:hypothetical protein [Tissierellia bacterium]